MNSVTNANDAGLTPSRIFKFDVASPSSDPVLIQTHRAIRKIYFSHYSSYRLIYVIFWDQSPPFDSTSNPSMQAFRSDLTTNQTLSTNNYYAMSYENFDTNLVDLIVTNETVAKPSFSYKLYVLTEASVLGIRGISDNS